jgi:signal transduction histidine kinase/CheY-like chemotaxis protein
MARQQPMTPLPPPPTLRDFLLPLQPWQQEQSLSVCLASVSTQLGMSGWAIVDQEQHPWAWLSAVALSKHLVNGAIVGLSDRPIQDLPTPILQRLPTLSVDLTLEDAWQQLQTENDPQSTSLPGTEVWALVDTKRKYVGMLDVSAFRYRCLPSIASQPASQLITPPLALAPPVPPQIFHRKKINLAGIPSLATSPITTPSMGVDQRLGYQLMSYEAAAVTHLGKTAGGSQPTLLSQLLLLQTQVSDLLQQQQQDHEFLAALSHELKTPLTSILGLTTVLGHPGLGELNPRQRHYVDVLRHTGQNMMALVQDLLDLTQLEMRQLPIHLQVLELDPLCQKVISQTQTQVAQVSQLSPAEHPVGLHRDSELQTVLADGLRLRQMLGNLLSHALHASSMATIPPETNIETITEATLSSPGSGTNPEVELKIWHWPGWICWQIRNQGWGIPVEQQVLLFDQFLRLNYPHNQRTQISSLGLLLARRLAQLHGGELSFWSFPQQGTYTGSEFTLLLPQPLAGTMTNLSAISPAPRLVLVATAAQELQADLLQYLQPPDTLLLVARTLPELLLKAKSLQPTVILLDAEFATTITLNQLQAQATTQGIPIGCLGTSTMTTPYPVFHLTLPIHPKQLEQIWQDLSHAQGAQQTSPKPIRPANPTAGVGTSRTMVSKPITKPNLTVLRIGSHTHLYLLQCRVLEAEDLEQAELLTQIWQPDVLLWDWDCPDLSIALLELSRHPRLASLPLVTLDVTATQAAAQLPQLQIFPCLVAETLAAASREQASQTLFQVLQVAASHRETVNNVS